MRALWSSPSQQQQQPDSKSTNQLDLTERPIPALAPSTILVKVSASGINPSDVANALKNAFGMFQPRIPGRDFAGVVHASNNPALPPGTAVYGTSGDVLSFTCDGTAAEYVLVPEDAVVPKPQSLSMAQAAVVGVPYTAALLALEATHTQHGADRVLILGGTGAVGTAVARIARCWGCSVVTTGRRDDADINIITDPSLQGISKFFENGKTDVVIDTIGSPTLMSEAMKALAPKGRYCVLAGMGETPKYDLSIVDLYRKNQTICGINSIAHQPAEMAERMKRLAEMFDGDGLEPPAQNGLTLLPIEKGVEAYTLAAQFKGRKCVIVFDDK